MVLPLQALDTFNTAVVSPIYYVMFTSLTIVASVIMFKVKFWPNGRINLNHVGVALLDYILENNPENAGRKNKNLLNENIA